MQYKILASDYDNTLVPFGEAKPRPAVVKAVKKLQAAGGKFVLSTGRAYPCVAKGQLGGIRFDYAITCNGACVVDRKGTIVAEHPLTNEEMYALVDFCEDYNYPLQFNFRDACYAYCEYEDLRSGYQKMNSIGLNCVDGEDQDRHLIDMPHAAFAAMPPEHVADFNEKVRPLGPELDAGGRAECRRLLLLRHRARRHGQGRRPCRPVRKDGPDAGGCRGGGRFGQRRGHAEGSGPWLLHGKRHAGRKGCRRPHHWRCAGGRLADLIDELWFDGPRAEPSGRDLGSPWDKIESAGGQ